MLGKVSNLRSLEIFWRKITFMSAIKLGIQEKNLFRVSPYVFSNYFAIIRLSVAVFVIVMLGLIFSLSRRGAYRQLFRILIRLIEIFMKKLLTRLCVSFYKQMIKKFRPIRRLEIIISLNNCNSTLLSIQFSQNFG